MKDIPDNENLLYEKIINKLQDVCSTEDLSTVERAYKLARTAHANQVRASGESYVIHPLSVAYILTEFDLDCDTVVSAILHDVVEDTDYTIEDIKENFGNDVAILVDGVTKLGRLEFNSRQEQQAESFRKMLLAMAKDIRVILIKLADRLHNMRTLKYLSEERQIRIARETLDIYAPIAHRLGMYKVKWELEDLALRYIDPDGYYNLVNQINQKRAERETYIAFIIATLHQRLKEMNIEADIEGRPKHFYSIYNKMKNQNKTLEQIYDLFAVRVIVNSVAECYTVLGMVHEMYKHMPGRFKDYISLPKPNMYSSLHTTVIGPNGHSFEVQIRTWDMHRIAETGIAAHWRYKENKSSESDLDSKLVWLRQLLDIQKDTKDAKEFMDNLKINLFTDEVFVFTPRGDVVTLPVNSTPIDFAYSIHSQIGNKMMGAKVNGKIVTLNYSLRNGDIVEILTSSTVNGPSRDWLKIAKSTNAKNKILQWFKKEGKEENIIKGKEAFEKESKKLGINVAPMLKNEDFVKDVVGKFGYNSLDDTYSSIGYGVITATRVLLKFKEEFEKLESKSLSLEDFQNKFVKEENKSKKVVSDSGVIVKGIDNCLVRLAKCCSPLPGESIVGYITRGRGVSVHRENCPNIKELMSIENRYIDVEWAGGNNTSYSVNLKVQANDSPMLLIGVSTSVNDTNARLKAINARTLKDKTVEMSLVVEISSTEQLNKIINSINRIKGVFDVVRVNGGTL